VFACPSCRVDCPRPWNGVKGLIDFTGDATCCVDLVAKPTPVLDEGHITLKKEQCKEAQVGITLDVKCLICLVKKKEVQAVNLCVECGHLYICQDCSEVHAKNKATKEHVVVPLKSEKKEAELCEKHNSVLNSYCYACGKAVCMYCVMLDHGDHKVEKLVDTIRSKVDEVKLNLENREEELEKLQYQKNLLTMIQQGAAPEVNKPDALLKDIEDHAEKFIDKIVKLKEDLKKQVKTHYQVIQDIPVGVEKYSKLVRKYQESISQATKLLSISETEHHPAYLDKLITMQQDLGATAVTADMVEGTEYWDKLGELYWNVHTFSPETVLKSIGKVTKALKRDIFKPEDIFKCQMQVNSGDMFIPHVANLGKHFAVAHPTTKGRPSDKIDIYEFPGTLKCTLKDHVHPIYDMSATPEGKLAVLSDGIDGPGHCVKLFDPNVGYISATSNLDIAKPISMGVTLRDQYVILGENEHGKKEIKVVDRNGTTEHIHDIWEFKITNQNKVTCGGSFVFVAMGKGAIVFEIKDTGLQLIKRCDDYRTDIGLGFTDISATVWDDFILAYEVSDCVFIEMYHEKDTDTILKWSRGKPDKAILVDSQETVGDREARLSIRDGHIVVSHGHTIRIYKR
jgi:O6-methylguanine-DNA--protein-cysteine methyltransferase